MRHQLTLLLSVLCSLVIPISSASDYHEQLVLKPLPLSALLASFNFRSNTTVSEFEAHNFRFFPRSLGQILEYSGTKELHLRFSLGRWDAESWGVRPWGGTREGGTGVELWAWLEADTEEEADRKWLTLTNALSGLFCASLNFIDGTRTTRPVMSFQPEGDHADVTTPNLHLLHGTLPREVVCTENLTPFLKLLPCKGKAGIASLLDGHKLFDSSWQSMAIDVKPVCPEEGDCVLEIEQSIDMVLDIERSRRPRDNPIPRPPPGHELKCNTSKSYHSDDTCFPVEYSVGQEWSISNIFGKSIQGSCPLADAEVPPVCLELPDSRPVWVSEGVQEIRVGDGRSRCYKGSPETMIELYLPQVEGEGEAARTGADQFLQPDVPPLYAERSLTGHGQERGGVQTILTNPSDTESVEFVYMESLPWFMRIYLHTLEARVTDTPSGKHENVIQDIYYRPALDRTRGTQLEVKLRIPPKSTVFLTYDFEKSILRYTEYPPDANRGFDVPGAVITILSGASTTSNLRTTALLLNLPTPDFSMPYNVIIFTSTAIALAFGGMFNLLVRRFVAADEGPEMTLTRLRNRLKERFAKGKGKQVIRKGGSL
ncbi:Gpi16 subunit, GPI transamidase component [Cryphonectria parasitica EP155]|uniref:Gpi16 subunit, GPI transamidase component n=1 Tax=Cryphonectria parasitica (strain ATCC 38755 / EP155) TaxID=660469 RepID=A0A9P4XVC2_CRYP1|nr:Gpi16 subunit, GPI transamidase component [Cryphonectria parasitica EP155]KAF3761588.1 Gpi16 subunit, GPI transamidase component [Cryphonectria parasitica EP155]